MMRRAIEVFVACLLAAGPLYAQQIGIPVKRGVITVDSAPSGDCSAVPGQVRQIRGTRETYVCEGGTWVRKDLPVCDPDPPSGSCSGYAVCMSTAGSLYVCASGSWVAVGGGSGDMEKSTYDPDADGTVEIADVSVALSSTNRAVVKGDADGDGTGDVCLDADGDDTCDVRVQDDLLLVQGIGSPIYSARIAWTTWDLNHDGTADEGSPYVDTDGDATWDVGEVLLAPPWTRVERFDDWDNWGADGGGGTRSFYSGYAPSWSGYRYDNADPEGIYSAVSAAQCYESADGNYCFFMAYAPDNNSNSQRMSVSKFRGFRVRAARHATNHAGTAIIGAVRTSTNGDLRTKTDGVFFWCDPSGDPDGDGTSGDSDGDADWWACTYSGATDCKQIADGDSDNNLDCDLDGTPDTTVSSFASHATCRRLSGQSCKTGAFAVFEIQRDGAGGVVFRVDADNGGDAVSWDKEVTITTTLPGVSHLVAGWLVGVDAEGSAMRIVLDWSYYVGVR